MYVPVSSGARECIVRDVDNPSELIVYRDFDIKTLLFGKVQVIVGRGKPSKTQDISTSKPGKPIVDVG